MQFRKYFNQFKLNSKNVSQSDSSTFMDFIETAPPEIFEEIFNKLPFKDILKCRILSKRLCMKVDLHYIKTIKVILEDQTFKTKLKRISYNKMFTVENIFVGNLVNSTLSRKFIKNSFLWVHSVELYGQISTTSFIQLTQIPCIENLKIHSLTLGGPLNLYQVNLKKNKKSLNNKNIPIKNLELNLDFIPCGTPGFSPLRLITNLKELQFWDIKFLNTISFNVISTCNEQFYFGFYTLLSSIPIKSHKSIQTLKISCSKFKSEDSSARTLTRQIFDQINLKNIEIRFQNEMNKQQELQNSNNKVINLLNELGSKACVIVHSE